MSAHMYNDFIFSKDKALRQSNPKLPHYLIKSREDSFERKFSKLVSRRSSNVKLTSQKETGNDQRILINKEFVNETKESQHKLIAVQNLVLKSKAPIALKSKQYQKGMQTPIESGMGLTTMQTNILGQNS